MPNWCENRVEIFHDDEKVIKKIQEELREDWTEEVDGETKTGTTWFSFSKLVPMPKEIRETSEKIFETQEEVDAYKEKYKDHPIIPVYAHTQEQADALQEKYGVDNWYDWAIENWGTKWEPNEVDMGMNWEEDNTLSYAFNTPWSPPIAIYHALIEKYPEIKENISWFYNEPGMQFAGYLNTEGK